MSSYRESALKILLAADVLFANSDGVAGREGCGGVSKARRSSTHRRRGR